MLVSIINMKRNLRNAQVIIYLLLNSQVNRYIAKIDEIGGILGVSVDRELFNLLTDIALSTKASQYLIRTILDFYHGYNIVFPLGLGEIKTPNLDNFKIDY
ncbi:MAG TPA: hypothetical protein IGS40_11200 [Trichormus sp. M33_DOE_039]|nr:hypothetical protein [Trichormus sp. M33_DOE_039]